ncbi:MAG: TIGR03086 family metal-binding protein [Actinomycetota bacterium]
MSENLRRYTRALYGFDAVVRRTPGEAWTHPSPCEGWTAADVVAHNVGMNEMIAGFTRGDGAPHAGHVETDDPAGSWASSLEALLAALDRHGALQTVAATPWGELAVEKFLGFVWVDPVIHTWDLAVAVGQAPVLDADLVALGAARLERAGDSLVGPGRFRAAVAVGDEATTLDRFISLSGRTP